MVTKRKLPWESTHASVSSLSLLCKGNVHSASGAWHWWPLLWPEGGRVKSSEGQSWGQDRLETESSAGGGVEGRCPKPRVRPLTS